MPAQYPSFNDREFDLQKKITNNTALLAEGGGGGGLPPQGGHSGEFLTTDGSAASWAPLAGGGDVVASGTLTSNRLIIGGGGTTVSASGSMNTNANGLLMLGASTGASFNPNIPGDTANGDLTGSNGLGLLGQIKQNYGGVTWAAGANIANVLYASGAPDAGGTTVAQSLRAWAEVTGANNSAGVTGMVGTAANAGSGTVASATGTIGTVRIYSSGGITSSFGVSSFVSIPGSGNITGAFNAFYAAPPTYSSTGRITGDFTGLLMLDVNSTNSVDEIYGVDIRDQTKGTGIAASLRGRMASGTGKYNLYLDGTAQNYLAGNLGVGTTPVDSISLVIGGTLTPSSGNVYGIYGGTTAPSTATALNQFVSDPRTVAAAFTLTTLNHYSTTAPTIGAGSSITTQTGFNAGSGLTNATNNYGFRGQIASGSNRYNLYMDGTAQNYLAGITGIGTAAVSTSALSLPASTTSVSSLNIPHGSAPSSPVNGDVWTTTSGMFARINGGTVGPFGSGSGSTAWGSTVGETDVASAGTTDLGAITDNAIRITGTTTITSFGTVAEGTSRIVRFDGALTLTYNASSLILPGAANITTAQGDSLIAYSLGGGNWKVTGYWKQDGTPLVIGANLNYGTNPGEIVVADATVNSSAWSTTHGYKTRIGGSDILEPFRTYDGSGNTTDSGIRVNGGKLLTTLSAYAAGTVYSLTNSSAALDFGTTDPSITITTAGTWKITACVQVTYTGATVVAETASFKLRRTNNTAADLTSSTVTIDLPVATTLTNTYGMVMLPAVYYTTANVNDVVTIFGNVSATLGAGTIDAAAAGTWIVAERIS